MALGLCLPATNLIAQQMEAAQDTTNLEEIKRNLAKEGEQAPKAFLKYASGANFFLSKWVGPKAKPALRKPLVLSFFATWCIPCKKEIPQLTILQERYAEIGIFLIDVNEPAELVNSYIEEFGITLEVLLDRYGKVAEKFGVVDENGIAHLPSLFIIDADGTIVLSHTGYKVGDEEHYDEVLKSLVAELTAAD